MNRENYRRRSESGGEGLGDQRHSDAGIEARVMEMRCSSALRPWTAQSSSFATGDPSSLNQSITVGAAPPSPSHSGITSAVPSRPAHSPAAICPPQLPVSSISAQSVQFPCSTVRCHSLLQFAPRRLHSPSSPPWPIATSLPSRDTPHLICRHRKSHFSHAVTATMPSQNSSFCHLKPCRHQEFTVSPLCYSSTEKKKKEQRMTENEEEMMSHKSCTG
ncbi:hypothetical protein M0R45_035507 [Rubus argutus]|uniref:Uncharacterized protein n=1 Tax=Rubus argutus TaxID=59490 RepID=A0AAW1VUH3_RUBAR